MLESHRSQLRTLGRPVESWDDWFVTLASAAMDVGTRRAWEEELEGESKSNNDTSPSFAQLTSFLQRRSRTLKSLETEQQNRSAGSSKKIGSTTFKPGLFRALATTTSDSTNRPCVACKGWHYLGHCENFKGLAPNERRRVVTHHGLCFNCLKSGHAAKTCPSASSCRTCNGSHHTSIHEGAGKRLGGGARPQKFRRRFLKQLRLSPRPRVPLYTTLPLHD